METTTLEYLLKLVADEADTKFNLGDKEGAKQAFIAERELIVEINRRKEAREARKAR